jgi:hypothetical protein
MSTKSAQDTYNVSHEWPTQFLCVECHLPPQFKLGLSTLPENAQTVFLILIGGRSLLLVSSSLAGPECIVLQ